MCCDSSDCFLISPIFNQCDKVKPTKVRVIDHQEHQSLQNFTGSLQSIASKLKEDGTFTLIEGDKVTTITPNQQLRVEYTYKTKGDKHEFEIQFKWNDRESDDPIAVK